MYQTPKLIRVGEAEKVILGVSPSGNDIDGNYVAEDSEFAGDPGLLQVIAAVITVIPLPM